MASLLESFVYVFQSDAHALDAGLQSSEQSINRIDEGMAAADDTASGLGATFQDVAKNAMELVASYFAIDAVIGGISEAVDFADKLGETAEALELNVEELSAWSDAAQMSGGSADAFQDTLKSLNTSMTTLDETGKSKLTPFFKELGINMLDSAGKVRPVMDLLPELAKSFEGLTKTQALDYGQKLGLDAGTVMMLQKGQREVEELVKRQKELGVVTAEDAEAAGAFNDSLDDTAHAFRSIYSGIGTAVLPLLTAFIGALEDGAVWVRTNKNLVTGFFIAVGAVIAYQYLPAAISAATATIIMAAPFILLAAVVATAAAAFALIYDDIMTFVDGGDSVTGRLLEWINSFELVKAVVNFVTTGFSFLSAQIGDFLTKSSTMKAIVELLTMSFDGWKLILDGIVDAFKWIVEKGAAVGNTFKNIAGFAGEQLTNALNAGTAAMSGASNNPLASQTSSSINSANSRSISLKMGDTNVHTQATDAKGISKSVSGHLGDQMKKTVANFDDGVAG